MGARMTTYNTRNPLGSSAPMDLYDNAANFDHHTNDVENEFWLDRFGRERCTLFGQEKKNDRLVQAFRDVFQAFLESSGYSGAERSYTAGIVLNGHNEGFVKCDANGSACLFYTPRAGTPLPYTTTGDWESESNLFIVRGDDSLRQDMMKQFGPSYFQFGAIRQKEQGDGWVFIDDADHRPRGFSGPPYVDANGDIIVSFDQSFPKVGSLLVCPDETLALFGITVGASVGLDFAAISMSKDMSLIVNLGEKTVDAETYFRPRVSMTENSDGTFTVTHPPVPSGFETPVMNPSFFGNVDARIVNFTSTTITIAPTVPLNGSVVFDGSDWNVVTAARAKPTVSFNAGVLTVTHQPISYAQEKFALISPRKPNVPISISAGTQQGLNSFSVEFRDPATGNLLSSVPAGSGFFYRRDVEVIAEQGAGSFFIKRGSVKLNAEDVFLENSNLWLLGMQIVQP